MWTCGIDMATQHETPATHSSTCTVAGFMPMGRSSAATCPPARTAAGAGWIGGRRRNTSASGSMDTTQNTPMPT